MSLIEIYNYRVVGQYLDRFIEGFLATLWISALCLLLSLIVGVGVAMARGSTNSALRIAAVSYVEIVRSTPLLAQVYLIYYGLSYIPALDVTVPALLCGVLALSLHTGAYMSEIVRAGIESVDRGQWEAAKACGMSRRQTLQEIIYPQAFANTVPPTIGQAAILIKDTSILSFIAVFELMGAGLLVLTDRVMPVESFITPALGYLLIYLFMLWLMSLAKRRFTGAHWNV